LSSAVDSSLRPKITRETTLTLTPFGKFESTQLKKRMCENTNSFGKYECRHEFLLQRASVFCGRLRQKAAQIRHNATRRFRNGGCRFIAQLP
jgi:hypothetical protein